MSVRFHLSLFVCDVSKVSLILLTAALALLVDVFLPWIDLLLLLLLLLLLRCTQQCLQAVARRWSSKCFGQALKMCC
jgi:hypothetical protein